MSINNNNFILNQIGYRVFKDTTSFICLTNLGRNNINIMLVPFSR